MESNEVKKILFDMGAVLCGIASVDRLNDVPEGFHPYDILPSCKSIVVFAKRFPVGTLHCNNTIPYTIVRNTVSDVLDKMSVQFCDIMEQHGIVAVPTGTISHDKIDTNTGRMRGPISIKHCAVAAGLGRMGKNTLITTPEYGNMIWLSAVLLDAGLEPDEILPGSPCPEGCSVCVNNCAAHAIDNSTIDRPSIDQHACYAYAFRKIEGEEFTFKCHKCRTTCPKCLGSKNANMKPRTE